MSSDKVFKGIDVSAWQKEIDFEKVRDSGIEFVIIRAGYGKVIENKDAFFETNYAKAKAAGLLVGAYWYSYADSIDTGRTEAGACLEAIRGKTFDFPVFFDLEEKKQFEKGREFCDALVTTFCDCIGAHGYYPGLYCSTNKLNEFVSPSVAGKYALWVAHWAEKCTYSANPVELWQYTSHGSVDGIEGRVDMDFAYVDYPKIIRSRGLAGPEGPEAGSK